MTHFKIKVRHIHLEVFPPDCEESQLKEAKNAKESSVSAITCQHSIICMQIRHEPITSL